VYCDKKIKEFKTRLREFRNNFDFFWNEIESHAELLFSEME
jgi:hypothetical protein